MRSERSPLCAFPLRLPGFSDQPFGLSDDVPESSIEAFGLSDDEKRH